jgi:hypothetical protein
MLHTMVELILTLSCIRIKTLLCFLYHLLNELAENKMKQPALSDSNVDNREGIKKEVLLLLLHLLLLNFVKTMMHLVIL